MAEAEQPQHLDKVPGWYRVCLNTIVRKTIALDSERIRILPMGSRVHVIKQQDRRVLVDEPVQGWCSSKSSNGETILENLQDSDLSVTTPSNTAAIQNTLTQATQNVQNIEQKEAQIQAKMKETQEQNPELTDIATQLEMLKKQVAERQQLKEQIKKADSELQVTKEDALKKEIQLQDLELELEDKKQEIALLNAKYDQTLESNPMELDPKKLTGELQQLQREKEAAQLKLKHLANLQAAANLETKDMNNHLMEMFKSEKDAEEYPYPYEDGDVILLTESRGLAIARWVGKGKGGNFSPDQDYIGLELSDPVGDTNGTVDGVTYFTVDDYKGLILPFSAIKRRIPPSELLLQLQEKVKMLSSAESAKE